MPDLVYSPPGIYIDENASPVPDIGTVVALPPARIALVGPCRGYREATETILLEDTAVTLSEKGIDTSSIVVTSLAGLVYTGASTDYTVAQTGTPPEEAVTTVIREVGGAITSGDIVYVSYQFSDSDFYLPYLSSDWDEIQTRYGPALDAAGAISSPLSLAAKIAFEHGTREIILVPTKGSSFDTVTADQLDAAYDTLDSRDDVGILVPIAAGVTGTDASPGDTTRLGTDLRNHINNAVTEGHNIIGILGYDLSVDRDHAAVAASVNDDRVVLVYPNSMNWYNGYTNLITEIDGFYLAAACAGILASNAPQEPLTLKSLASFSSIPARIEAAMTKTFKDTLSQAGVSVVESRTDGRIVVRHGVSTNMSTDFTREISITRAKDAMLSIINDSLDSSGIIGDYTDEDSPLQVRSIVEGALEQAKSSNIIINYSALSVRAKPNSPTVMQVAFAYAPAYPLNKVTVSFSINTETGIIQEG